MEGRNIRHVGYHVSQRVRKQMEEVFNVFEDDWVVPEAGGSRSETCRLDVHFTAAAYKLVWARNLSLLPSLAERNMSLKGAKTGLPGPADIGKSRVTQKKLTMKLTIKAKLSYFRAFLIR